LLSRHVVSHGVVNLELASMPLTSGTRSVVVTRSPCIVLLCIIKYSIPNPTRCAQPLQRSGPPQSLPRYWAPLFSSPPSQASIGPSGSQRHLSPWLFPDW